QRHRDQGDGEAGLIDAAAVRWSWPVQRQHAGQTDPAPLTRSDEAANPSTGIMPYHHSRGRHRRTPLFPYREIHDMTIKRFDGKRVLVTGGASGIGRATAERLGAEGAALVLADYNLDGAREVATAIAAAHGAAAS